MPNPPLPCPVPGLPSPPSGQVISIFVGDAVVLPLTWWQIPPVLASDGVTVVTPGVPVNMTGMQPSAEFLTYGLVPGQGAPLAVTNFVPASGTFTVTVPGGGQPGDLTSSLVAGPPKLLGPRIRVRWTDASGNPQTFGDYYLAVS